MAKISGAIFDCDGTLLDSMCMWNSVFARLVESYGIDPTPELIARIEAATLPHTSEMLHEDYGAGASSQEVLDHIHSVVLNEYVTNIKEMPGARAFVESLAAEGIPMIVASSTTSSVLRHVLAHFKLDKYFIDIICTAEVRDGRDKDFPDVYLEALSRLGTPIEETWVFEDAPFAVRSSRSAGFHVAGIHNDHDGRDPEFIRAWSDIYSENYESISLEAIRDFDDASRKPLPEEA